MARIRSTHPGQWTDEAFATLDPLAHLLAIGLRNEADDLGVFEWRPVQLKMRLLPMYPCDVADLLQALEAADIVRHYEIGGKAYGAIRNFCRYQSPDKPRAVYPRAEWVDEYVARTKRPVIDRSGGSSGGVADTPPTNPTPIDDVSATYPTGREGKGKEEDRKGHDAPAGATTYRWSGRVIRLSEADYDRWRTTFHGVDLDAELLTLDQFLNSQRSSQGQRKDWFFVASGALKKRHQAAIDAKKAARDGPKDYRLDPRTADIPG